MNKKRVEKRIAPAVEVLKKVGIVEVEQNTGKGFIDKTFRGQISSFGAAVTMGSLKAAVAFFSKQGGSDVDREKLVKALYMLVTGNNIVPETTREVFDYICANDTYETKEDFIDASLAIKLAMNFFKLK